jgi:hypothetical protein
MVSGITGMGTSTHIRLLRGSTRRILLVSSPILLIHHRHQGTRRLAARRQFSKTNKGSDLEANTKEEEEDHSINNIHRAKIRLNTEIRVMKGKTGEITIELMSKGKTKMKLRFLKVKGKEGRRWKTNSHR